MRGKPRRDNARASSQGLIPACAGKTLPRYQYFNRAGAHPRVCGENDEAVSVADTREGSSPRVRGKRLDAHTAHQLVRLIPACAGKTSRTLESPRWNRAHPRVCGENSVHSQPLVSAGGSSPRVRGKPWDMANDPNAPGLIPACAGKTTARARSSGLAKAHPRVCGENCGGDGDNADSLGSSPRVRGKRLEQPTRPRTRGLIPACAGKTSSPKNRGYPQGAHPRVCGENSALLGSRGVW